MNKNMGKTDSTARLIIGCIVIALGFHFASMIVIILGGVLLLTSFSGICPAYLPFKFNTCGGDETLDEPKQDDKPDS